MSKRIQVTLRDEQAQLTSHASLATLAAVCSNVANVALAFPPERLATGGFKAHNA